jgi:HPt (histidine-containing phosphotransfer) domain-containing protein
MPCRPARAGCCVNVALPLLQGGHAPAATQSSVVTGRPTWPTDAMRLGQDRPDDTPATTPLLHLTPPMLSLHPRSLASPESPGGSAAGRSVPDSGGADPTLATLDAEALERLETLDPTGESRLMERVLQAFQNSAVRLLAQLEPARRNADRAATRIVAHTLKSSSASIGALTLSKLCAQVEAAIRLDTPVDLDADIAAMTDELDRVLRAIERMLLERAP